MLEMRNTDHRWMKLSHMTLLVWSIKEFKVLGTGTLDLHVVTWSAKCHMGLLHAYARYYVSVHISHLNAQGVQDSRLWQSSGNSKQTRPHLSRADFPEPVQTPRH